MQGYGGDRACLEHSKSVELSRASQTSKHEVRGLNPVMFIEV